MQSDNNGILCPLCVYTSIISFVLLVLTIYGGSYFMHKTSVLNLQISQATTSRIQLSALWILGLAAGIVLAFQTDSAFHALMRRAFASPVSIVGFAVVFGLPFLFTAFAVMISQPGILLLAAFGKAFSFGFIACTLELAFAPAGWLLRLLFLFSDLASLPALLWLWQRGLEPEKPQFWRDALCYGVFCFLVGSLDYYIVSPSLVMLIS